MSPLEMLGFALGTSFASGLNLYATAATLGLLHRFGGLPIPAALEPLGHPVVLALAIALFVIEFFADKVPYVDTVWDAIHTFIRPPAAALAAYAVFGSVPETWRAAAALLSGTVALAAHGAKASARAGANVTPEPFTNWTLSLAEDFLAAGLAWLAATHPYITMAVAAVLVALAIVVIRKLYRFFARSVRGAWRRRPLPDRSQ
jgi:hypothetical protein